jgi:peptidoglycan/LPS O-acetylase OafA/YrhL
VTDQSRSITRLRYDTRHLNVSRERYFSLEALRAIAAVMVVIAHAAMFAGYVPPQKTTNHLMAGRAGVDLFFVLSGFIISRVHWFDLGRPERLRGYLWRRFVRIFPIYWVALIIAGVLTWYLPNINRNITWSGRQFAENLTLIPTAGWTLISPAWSLQYELTFYAVFGLAILSSGIGACVAGIWAGVVISHWGAASTFPLSFFTNPRAIQFGVGWLVARWVDHLPRGVASPVAAAGAALFGAVLVADSIGWPGVQFTTMFAVGTPGNPVIYAIAAAALIGGLVRGDRRNTSETWPTRQADLWGGASYAIYLIHYPVIASVFEVVPFAWFVERGPWITMGILSVIGVISGMVLHVAIERPLLAWLRGWKMVGRRESSTPVPGDERQVPAMKSAERSLTRPTVDKAPVGL